MIILRKTIFFLLLLLTATSTNETFARKKKSTKIASVAPTTRISREEYINRYRQIAIDHQKRYNIPASITMAQGILESDCGNSRLARASNNHFGIKCKGDWKGKFVRHDDDAPNECFRAYDSVEKSYEDHAKFLDNSPRYDSLFRFAPIDYRSWARGLKNAGYATAPTYTQMLIRIIEDSNLHELDLEAAGVNSATSAYTPRNGSNANEQVARSGAMVDPNNFRVTVNTTNGYNLFRTNQKLYVVSKEGDSFRSIARKFSLSQSTLRKYNDITDRRAEPTSGNIIYIEKKGSKWLGEFRDHRVATGETIYSISQLYGIKERSLRSMNKLKVGEVAAGGVIKLRRR
ncbi:MAG: glucosaminidase domain-containing protein [Rikenellaceae bacterium]